MQEGDVQIKGYPVRLPLDLMLVFTANPEDYTARGKIITPLKDRIGSEIRTHYPATLEQGIAITEQEAWLERTVARAKCGSPITCARWWSSWRFWRAKTSASTSARASRSGCRSRCSKTSSRTPSAARSRPSESVAVPRVAGPLRRAALHHRQARAGIRRRAERRRRRGARDHPHGRGQGLRPLLRGRQRRADRAVVRPGRIAEAG